MRPVSVRRGTFVAGAAAAFGSIGFVRAPARAAQYEVKCAFDLAADHPISLRVKEMWDAVAQESGGRFTAQFFPNSQLGGDNGMFSQLRSGAIQFLLLSSGVLSAVVPSSNIGYVGFAFKDEDEALRAMKGPLTDYIRQEGATKGITIMRGIWDDGMNYISSSTHPIKVPADLAGFKLRVVPSRILVDMFKTFNASPVPLSFAEVYTSLQTKVVDGQACPLATFVTSKFFEVQKYMSLTAHTWSAVWMIANGDYWKTLPPDIQGIIERNELKYSTLVRADDKAEDAKMLASLTARGMVVNPVDPEPFRALLKPYYQTWAENFGPTEWGLLEAGLGRKLT